MWETVLALRRLFKYCDGQERNGTERLRMKVNSLIYKTPVLRKVPL